MDAFNYRDGELFAEGVALTAIAERFGTPTYVYSRAHIEAQYNAYAHALNGMPHLVCFAVKANSNLAVLNVLARLGAGFDIVSRGELERVLAAGGSADKIVFSGVGKTRDDMRRALEVGVHCFNVESTDELERLLGGIMLQVERYPALRGDESVSRVQSALSGLEEQLSAARRTFNAAATSFNNSIEMFPGNLLAGLFGFRRRSLLEIPAGDRNVPDVHALFQR